MSSDIGDRIGQRDCGIEGRLAVRLEVSDGAVRAVDISSTRPLGAASVLEGREVMDAIKSLRLLYSLCGTAHTVAGLEAAEDALGIAPAPAVTSARRLLVAGEALGQAMWRLMLDLPQMAGEETAFDALRDARARIARLAKTVYPRTDWVRLGGAGADPKPAKVTAFANTMEEIARLGIFGPDVRAAEVLATPEALAMWAARGATPIARVVRTVLDRDLAGFGAAATPPLPDLDRKWLAEQLAGEAGRAFAARPEIDGTAYQTGAGATYRGHPLIVDLTQTHGAGLLAQLAARIVSVDALITDIRKIAGELEAKDETAEPGAPARASGAGVATVETARGLLAHYVEIEGGRTATYRILAPTEWNFHPEGVLATGLKGAGAEEVSRLKEAASLLVTAIDPCVQFDVEIV
ncbi:nickel-dependent hydrogenase large subunit [Rhodobium gokarnense]|uniref:Coenzyme F420-reducing hydrogenase alpha subunit n=1 Tax=Rhodobium gokarnense TaxID=364296 RepID=A0ABT3HIA5_9HYPH|nr:nickel-dependent hydrogenase large subunit [Rhodobium gokarnense]MCW2310128.1 coenzyme F420-reducing hydrogenase alpha subunit [Rhodobium gokarnense]